MEDQAEQLRELMRAKNNSTQSAAPTNTKQSRKTRIITVASGKGGVGKTNVSVNMALAYARLGKKVIVMDADLGLANVNVMLNMIPKYNLYHVIRKQKTMKDILLDTEYGIQIVAGASGFSKIANLSEDERQNFINELYTLSNADIIIIDTSAGVSNNVLSFVAAADDAVIVTTPEPTAITDAYGIIKIIATEIDNLNMGLKLVVNRVKTVAEAKKVADRMINIAGQFLNLKVDYLGFIYDDPAVPQAVLRQKPFMVLDPKSKASLCMQHIVGRMEKTEIRQDGGLGNLIKRLFNRE
ncbi:MAG TPA: MinD/ParA family protein [Treponema sp.]|jgi:flagellar biosynthesis protein FlhG|uniref:MinD/ParA family protein n=1 Tax=Gracilinema caldarium TaxID=215591 RepID=UPI0016906919|nr:MinD/ParA family protein [Gracilinema caldarium]NLJ08741.1 MinD/ParA family protein [Treponema sp.]HON12624.1 MinD/ParA family protein [Treponema sp.]HPC70317.1 MinD/ParA family protein [Treponema sp.]HRS02807.1 MinD/ParA family protein [Treponema sp.]HRU27403.1 MinD/ParA family protein [Treponema sp.]